MRNLGQVIYLNLPMKNIVSSFLNFVLAAMLIACGAKNESAAPDATPGSVDRTILPVREPVYPEDTTLDARNAKAPAPFMVNAPEKAPNVVIVLIDDQGFGQ